MVSETADQHQTGQDVQDGAVTGPRGSVNMGTGRCDKEAYVVTLNSSTSAVRQALEDLHQHLIQTGTPQDLCETAQIALAEVLNNIVEHAYRFEAGHRIILRLTRRDAGLSCETQDEGVAMPNGEPPLGAMPEVDPDAIMDLAEGGFGWAMVRELTQDIVYRREGSVNRLRFLIPARTEDDLPAP